MRYQDRLLRGLSHADLHYRAFVARQVERLVVHFDSEDVVQTMRASWHEAAGPVALHFACAYNEFYSRHLRALFSPALSPVHSQLIAIARPPGSAASRSRMEARDTLSRSATHVLEPCILALAKRAEAAPAREKRALMATLARFHHSSVERFLAGRLADETEGPVAALLLAYPFGTLDDSRILARLEGLWSQDSLPQFLLALRYLPTEASLAFLKRAARHRSPAVQWLSALCLDHFGRYDISPLVESIFEGQFGWAVAHALESLGRVGLAARGTPFIARALEKFDHPLVRTTALRALGSIGGQDGIDLCLREIESAPSPHSLAQAMSTLVQLGAPPDLRKQVFLPRLKTPHLEAATQAILGLVGADNAAAGKAIRDMIVEGGEDERVQAAYCLGYYPGESSVRVLEHLIRTDPSPAVRQQAIRAFSYYELTPPVVGRLASFLELEDERVALDAIRILSRPGAAENDAAFEAIGAVARYGASGLLRRHAARALGRHKHRLSQAYVQETLGNRGADPDTLLGAVEGLGQAQPPAPELDALRGLVSHATPAVRAAASRVLFSWGSLEGIEALPAMLAGPGPEAREACKALDEMATVSDYFITEPRFSTLADLLRANLRAPDYLQFSQRELGLVVAPAEPADGYEPHAAVLANRSTQSLELDGETAGHVLAEIDAARNKFPTKRGGRRQRVTREESPPLPGPEDRLSAGEGRSLPWKMAAGGVLVGVAAFGLYFATAGRQEQPAAEGVAPPPVEALAGSQALVVASSRGVAQVEKGPGSTDVLGPESQILPGQKVIAGKSAMVRMGLQPAGNTLILQGEGAFVFDGLEVESSARRAVVLRVSSVTGQLVFDLKWGRPRVELLLGHIRVKGWKGLYAVQSSGSTHVVKVASGRVEVTDKLGQYTLVTEGQKLTFKGGSEKGETGSFDPASESWK